MLKKITLFLFILISLSNVNFSLNSMDKETQKKEERIVSKETELWFWRLAYPITIIAGWFAIYKLNSKIDQINEKVGNLEHQTNKLKLNTNDIAEKLRPHYGSHH